LVPLETDKAGSSIKDDIPPDEIIDMIGGQRTCSHDGLWVFAYDYIWLKMSRRIVCIYDDATEMMWRRVRRMGWMGGW